MIKLVLGSLLLIVFNFGFAAEPLQPLAANKAFILTTTMDDQNTLNLSWKIAPSYYLYKDKFSFTPNSAASVKLGVVLYPPAHEKEDAFRGKYQVYTDAVNIAIPLNEASLSQESVAPVNIDVKYQGCSSQGFCYPPVVQTINVDLKTHTVSVLDDSNSVVEKPSEQSYITHLLAGKHYWAIIFGFLGLGLLLAFTPCVLPMIPIISGIIIGYGNKISTRKAFSLALSYVLGMAIAYALAGMLVASVGGSIQAALQKPWVIGLFSGVFVLLSLSLFGLYDVT
jgi:thiol:disulfide interchange protein DsbD